MEFSTMMDIADDLHRVRPSNFYPPEGFYPNGSYDPFWFENQRFLPHTVPISFTNLHWIDRKETRQPQACYSETHRIR